MIFVRAEHTPFARGAKRRSKNALLNDTEIA
jgi:hypothetical protein